ncbi:MAG: hypothetical protein P8186_22565, partial [Anaerolineae bacterium]
MSTEYAESTHSQSREVSDQAPGFALAESRVQGRSPTREALRRLRRDRMAVGGIIFLLLVAFLTFTFSGIKKSTLYPLLLNS